MRFQTERTKVFIFQCSTDIGKELITFITPSSYIPVTVKLNGTIAFNGVKEFRSVFYFIACDKLPLWNTIPTEVKSTHQFCIVSKGPIVSIIKLRKSIDIIMGGTYFTRYGKLFIDTIGYSRGYHAISFRGYNKPRRFKISLTNTSIRRDPFVDSTNSSEPVKNIIPISHSYIGEYCSIKSGIRGNTIHQNRINPQRIN